MCIWVCNIDWGINFKNKNYKCAKILLREQNPIEVQCSGQLFTPEDSSGDGQMTAEHETLGAAIGTGK